MKAFTLPKKFEMKHRDYPFVYDDKWISNGQFMIKKEIVKDSFKYCVPLENAQANCERLFPCFPIETEWTKTNIIYDCGELGYLRVFKCEELDKTICFKDEYVNHFGIKVMKGNGEALMEPFVSGDSLVVLMPCRHKQTSLN